MYTLRSLGTFLLYFCLARGASTVKTIAALYDKRYEQLGHVNLGGVFSVFRPGPVLCRTDTASAVSGQYLLAAIRGVQLVNADPHLLGNITMGLVALDDCYAATAAVGQALKLIAGKSDDLPLVGLKPADDSPIEIVGLLGAPSSSSTSAIASIFNLFDITMISPTATSDDLSNRFKYPNFFRMVPPNSFQAKVIIDLCVHFNWTYVSVVHAQDTYGYGGLKFTRRYAKREGLCIADSFPMAGDFSNKDFEDTVKSLKRVKKARVVVVLAAGYHIRKLLQAAHRLGADMFVWILGDAAYAGTVAGVEDISQGSFIVDWHIPMRAGFQNNMETTTLKQFPRSPYILEMWRSLTDKCNRSTESTSECQNVQLKDLDGYSFVSPPLLMEESIFVYGHVLDSLIRDNCPEALADPGLLGDCIDTGMLREYLHKVRLPTPTGPKEFNENGEMYLDYRLRQVQGKRVPQVGVWEYRTRIIDWWKDWERWDRVPESVCAKPCGPGEFYIQGELPCCWECYRCRNNEIVTANLSACETCPQLTWPDQNIFEVCLPIEPSFLTWSDLYGTGLLSLAGVGFLFTMITIVVVIRNRHRRVIKGATWEMITIILIGDLMIFVDIPIFISHPTDVLCVLGRVLFSLSSTLVFAPLVMKTYRVYLVFRASEKLTPVSVLAKSEAQYTLMACAILAQVALLCVSLTLWPVMATHSMPVLSEPYVELHCAQAQEGLLIPLSYNLLLIVVCSFLAFLTRKLPDNFNESWYIFLNVTTTLFVWIAFLPTYYAAFFAYHKSSLLGLALILNGIMALVCLFGPKMYALAFIPDKDIKVTDFSSLSFEQQATQVSKVN